MAEYSTAKDPSRSAGAAFAQTVERDKAHRGKARSFRPLLQLWPFAARYKIRMALFLVFLAASTLMTLGVTFLVRGIIDCGFGGVKAPAYCTALPAMNTSGSGLSLTPFFAAALIFAVCFALISSTRAYLINTLGEKIVADIRAAVFTNLMRLSPAYFERVRTGEVLSRLTTDTTLVETVVTGSISFAIRSLATMAGALVLMFIVSWKLSFMVLAIGPLIIIPAIIVGKHIRNLSRGGQDMLAQASARAGESLSSIQTVQAFTRETYESDSFSSDIYKTYAIQSRRLKARFYLMSFIISAGMMSVIGILWYGAASVQAGKLDGGAIGQFALLAFLVVSNAGMLSETWTNLLRAAGASERLTEILDEAPGIAAPQTPLENPQIEGRIAFENVGFSYPSRPDEQALKSVSFDIKPGDTVALVGPSGAGKSTVFQLLLRFYDVDQGTITLDGHKLDAFRPEDLRRQFAIVQQNTPLFSGSAMNNIRYGRLGASDEDVIAAAKAANAHEFIEKLPGGYHTDLGERAGTLSGGQRQRIAIARAILRAAPVLLLDEATSALDAESELAVQNAFEALSKDRTTLVIAHRLATVLQADRIIVLDDGRVAEQGTHAELIKQSGLYARLAELQFSQSD